jgi:hypothetical protein
VNPLADPAQMEGMMDGMKKQAVMMIPNMVVMQWINVFFSGFVLSTSRVLRPDSCVPTPIPSLSAYLIGFRLAQSSSHSP